MEDSKNKEAQKSKEDQLVELTPAMELQSRSVKIIDLTEALQQKSASTHREKTVETPSPLNEMSPQSDSEPETEPDILATDPDAKQPMDTNVSIELDQTASAKDTVRTPIVDLGVDQPVDLPPEDVSDLLSGDPMQLDPQTPVETGPAAPDDVPVPEEALEAGDALDFTDVFSPEDLIPSDEAYVADHQSEEQELHLPIDDEPAGETEPANQTPAFSGDAEDLDVHAVEPDFDQAPVERYTIDSDLDHISTDDTLDLVDAIRPIDLMPADESVDVDMIGAGVEADVQDTAPEPTGDQSPIEPEVEPEPESELEPMSAREQEPTLGEGQAPDEMEKYSIESDLDNISADDTLDLTEAIKPIDLEAHDESRDADLEAGVEDKAPEPVDDQSSFEIGAEPEPESEPEPMSAQEQETTLGEGQAPDEIEKYSIESDLDNISADDTLDLTEAIRPIDLEAHDESLDADLEADVEDEAPQPVDDQASIELGAEPEPESELEPMSDQEQPEDLVETDASEIVQEIVPDTDAFEDEALILDDIVEPLDGMQAVEDGQEDDSIELLDVVPSGEPQSREIESQDEQDEEAIELSDIIAPVDLATASMSESGLSEDESDWSDEDDTIELVDIVDPSELAAELGQVDIQADTQADTQADIDDSVASDEDTIELLDTVDPDEVTAAFEQMEARSKLSEQGADVDEDEAIEMVDIVSSDASETAGGQQDDSELIEIIDSEELEDDGILLDDIESAFDDEEALALTDVVDSVDTQTYDAEPMESVQEQDDLSDLDLGFALEDDLTEGDAVQDAESDDTTIDIIDFADELQQDEAPAPQPDDKDGSALHAPGEETDSETGDQVIQLDSVLRHVRDKKQQLVEDITAGVEQELTKDSFGPQGDKHITLGMSLDDIKDSVSEAIDIKDKDLEKVIEDIIRTKYAETIEQYIATTVEKVVTREMESIKRSLMEDHGEDE